MNKIPLCRAEIGDDEIQAVVDVLKSGWLTHGPKTTEFEEAFAHYNGVDHAIAMNSCTSALFLSLIANDIKGEVVLPSFTFVASANAIVTAGATPVFCEVDPVSCNVTAELIAQQITSRTEAVMVVHYAGQCCEMEEIAALCEKHNLFLIEDSAETIGGKFNGKPAGSWGAGCWSFFPTKNITTGEGGMLTTNDDDLAYRVRRLVGHGIDKNAHERQFAGAPWKRVAIEAGYNFRLSNILATIGVEQMKKIDDMNNRRRSNSHQLLSLLADVDDIGLPVEGPGCHHVYQMFTVKMHGRDRDECVRFLRAKGIEASVHFDPPVHLHPCYQDIVSTDLSGTERLAQQILTLPMFPALTDEQVLYISKVFKECLQQN